MPYNTIYSHGPTLLECIIIIYLPHDAIGCEIVVVGFAVVIVVSTAVIVVVVVAEVKPTPFLSACTKTVRTRQIAFIGR